MTSCIDLSVRIVTIPEGRTSTYILHISVCSAVLISPSHIPNDTHNHRRESTNRLAMATFWHTGTFHHDSKFSPAENGVHALPISLYLPSRAKLWCTLQPRGQLHSSYFSSAPCGNFWPSKPWIRILIRSWIRFRIDLKCWTRIRNETYESTTLYSSLRFLPYRTVRDCALSLT